MAYRSADAMLERYVALWSQLGSAQGMRLPDARTPSVQTTPSPGNTMQQRLTVEYADIAKCVKLARLASVEKTLLGELYRPRHRVCRPCSFTTPICYAHCPRCGAGRYDGWTYEPLPTLPVLAAALSKKTKQRWSRDRVRRARDQAFDRLEAAMRRRGMLDE